MPSPMPQIANTHSAVGQASNAPPSPSVQHTAPSTHNISGINISGINNSGINISGINISGITATSASASATALTRNRTKPTPYVMTIDTTTGPTDAGPTSLGANVQVSRRVAEGLPAVAADSSVSSHLTSDFHDFQADKRAKDANTRDVDLILKSSGGAAVADATIGSDRSGGADPSVSGTGLASGPPTVPVPRCSESHSAGVKMKPAFTQESPTNPHIPHIISGSGKVDPNLEIIVDRSSEAPRGPVGDGEVAVLNGALSVCVAAYTSKTAAATENTTTIAVSASSSSSLLSVAMSSSPASGSVATSEICTQAMHEGIGELSYSTRRGNSVQDATPKQSLKDMDGNGGSDMDGIHETDAIMDESSWSTLPTVVGVGAVSLHSTESEMGFADPVAEWYFPTHSLTQSFIH